MLKALNHLINDFLPRVSKASFQLVFLMVVSSFLFSYSMQSTLKKISSMNVLLPICSDSSCNPVYTTITSEGGCFEWSVENPAIVSLVQSKKKSDSEKCRSKATISPKTRNPNEITDAVARDIHTNEVFKCKLGFAEVKTISIENSFDRMFVGELFELHVQAHDSRGNIFSSLEGWKFNWRIIAGNESAELIKLSNNGRKRIGRVREEIEKSAYSDIILIKGIQTGKISVVVEILEDELKNKISTESKDLFVIEPFVIIPEKPVYILPDTEFEFNVKYVNANRTVNENERKFFTWSIDKTDCGKIDQNGMFKSFNSICTAEISVVDQRWEDYNKVSTFVHVVHPTHINIGYSSITEQEISSIIKTRTNTASQAVFKYSPLWKLVEKKHYLAKNVLLFEHFEVIFDHSKIKFKVDYLNIAEYIGDKQPICFDNNEFCVFTTTKTNINNDQYSQSGNVVESSVDLFRTINLKISKNVIIYHKVTIEKFDMEYFTLPYLGYLSTGAATTYQLTSQELNLIVTGGTGKYQYTTSDSSIININSDNVLLGKELGKANIKVIDIETEDNWDDIDIYVKEFKDFSYFEERQEIMVNNIFSLTPIGVHSSSLGKSWYDPYTWFTNCTNAHMKHDYHGKDGNIDLVADDKYSNYEKIVNFITNNEETVNSKLKMNNYEKHSKTADYFKYSNFGICNINTYTGKFEGLIKFSFKALVNKRLSKGTINTSAVSSLNSAQVYWYNPITISKTISDDFSDIVIREGNLIHPDKESTFILSEGSSIRLTLKGGVIPWSDSIASYNEDKAIVDRANNIHAVENVKKIINIKSVQPKLWNAECISQNNEFNFMVTSHNTASPLLIKPAMTKITFLIGCYMPKTLSIYLMNQAHNVIDDSVNINATNTNSLMFNIPQREGLEYFIKKNSTDVLRVYAFDDSHRMFSNITLWRGFWKKISNNEYFEIWPVNKYSAYNTKHLTPEIGGEFIQDVVWFKNIITKFNLKHILRNDLLSHYATINLIDLPELLPSNYTLYVREDNVLELSIINGSGDFDISWSDDSLAAFTFNKETRKIYLTPRKYGIVYVIVKDNHLSKTMNYIIKSKIFLSDVKSIHWIGGGLLMVNKTTVLTYEIIDTFDTVYSPEQISKINWAINEDSLVTNGLEIGFNTTNITRIDVTGLIADLYPITIRDMNSKIISNIANIEVFNRLEIFPPYLLMVPGSSYTLSVIGGPSSKENVMMKYEMDDSKIANVSSINYPEVAAKLIGATQWKITLLYKYDYNKFYNKEDDKHIINKTEELCIEYVPVRVDFPNNIEIIGAGNGRKIYTKSTIRLLTALKKDNEVFTYGIGPFSFQWTIDNTLLAKVHYYVRNGNKDPSSNELCTVSSDSHSNEECTMAMIPSDKDENPDISIGAFLYSYEEGLITVTLTAEIKYPSPYEYHKPYSFTTSEKISINDEIFVNIPEFYGESPKKGGLYMVPFGIDHEWHTNKNTIQKFSILSQYFKDNTSVQESNNKSVISWTESGRLTSYHKRGLAYVTITQTNSVDNVNNNVPVILPVFVSEFHSIFIEKTHQMFEMEIGQEMSLKVIIQHEYGLIFAEKFERMKLSVVVSHPKVAACEWIDSNSLIKIKAHNVGNTNIILFHPTNRKIYDVFQVTVSKAVTLWDEIILNIGGTINFYGKSKERKSQISRNSEWISDNTNVVTIDSASGIAKGISEGTATIYWRSKDKSKVKISTKVKVAKVFNLYLDRATIPSSLTDIKSSKTFQTEHRIPIILLTKDNKQFTNSIKDNLNLINQNINIKCVCDNSDVAIAEANLTENNENECIIKVRDSNYSDTPKPKDITLRLISESISPYNKNDINSFETKEVLPFTSAFKIQNNKKTIELSHRNRSKLVYIDNWNDLTYHIQDENLLKIGEVNKEKRYIEIHVPNSVVDEFKGEKVVISNILSGQKEEILVDFVSKDGGATLLGISNSTLTDFITLIVMIVIFVLIFKYFGGETGSIGGEENNRGENTYFNNNYNYANQRRDHSGRPIRNTNNMNNMSTPQRRFGPKGNSINNDSNLNMEHY